MPRFEMHLFIVEKDDGEITSAESKVICWVNNSNDMAEVQESAGEILYDKIHDSDQTIIFGSANIMIKGETVMSLAFRNDDIDPDEVNSVMDLMTTEEETVH